MSLSALFRRLNVNVFIVLLVSVWMGYRSYTLLLRLCLALVLVLVLVLVLTAALASAVRRVSFIMSHIRCREEEQKMKNRSTTGVSALLLLVDKYPL